MLSIKFIALTLIAAMLSAGATAIVVFAMAGSGSKTEAASTAPGPVASSPAVSVPEQAANPHNDPCSLLTTSEVEAVLGPLAGPPFQANDARPRANSEECRYETPGFRAISVKVKWKNGARMIGMMGAVQGTVGTAGLADLKLFDGTSVAGAWDSAVVSQCCAFNALRGDQLVTVDVAGSHATLQQAAKLADAAVKRLGQPLTTASEEGAKAAQERFLSRPKRRSVCDLVTQAEAEAITHVHLNAPPNGNPASCTYSWPFSANEPSYTVKLEVTWLGGFETLRQTQFTVGNTSAMIGLGKPSNPAKPVSGPWDDFAQSIIGVMADKNDVLVSVESGPLRADISRRFVERGIENLTR